MSNRDYLKSIFRLKVALLSSGFAIDAKILEGLKKKGFLQSLGRKGGAGPAGGRYFKLSEDSIVNAQIWIDQNNDALIQIDDINDDYSLNYSFKDKSAKKRLGIVCSEIKISLIPIPKYYSKVDENNIKAGKIALIHGNKAIATTIYQRCIHWESGNRCKFCAIEKSLENNATIEEKTGEQIVNSIIQARADNPEYAQNVTLTSGTTPDKDGGVGRYIEVVSKIRETFPKIPIHIQIEPVNDINLYRDLFNAGINTIGIHLEILDDNMRKQLCPGKSHIPKETYYQHWVEAIKIFGKNQVDSYILMGYQPNLNEFKSELLEIIKLGVIPLITPTRPIPTNETPIPKTSFESLLEITEYAAKMLKKYDINPLDHIAGCIKCGGCSAINDAYRILL